MSLARVTTVQRSMKPYTCESCSAAIPKGSAYRWYKVGFRSRYRHIRCMDEKCTPRPSELESSLLSGVYAAQESAHDSIDAAESVEDVQAALEELASEIQSVADQYDEASTDENGTEWNTEAAERRDILSGAADELGSVDLPDGDCDDCGGDGKVDCEKCGGSGEQPDGKECLECESGQVECEVCKGEGSTDDSLDEAKQAARDAVDLVELP